MKKLFAVLALTGMMVAVSAPAVFAANGKNVTVLVSKDKEKKKEKKKAKTKACSGDTKAADGKSCGKAEGKCCKGKAEAQAK